jgi:hypothetical protein
MKTPQISVNKFTGFVGSKEVLTAAAVVFATPLVLKSAEGLIQKIPFLNQNFTLGLVAMAFIVFMLSSMVGGIFRTVAIGIAAGLLITAATPFISPILGKVGQ